MTLSETRALIEARPDATPEQWATLRDAVRAQPDAEFLADVLDLHRAMHDQAAGVDRARAALHTRQRSIPGRKA